MLVYRRGVRVERVSVASGQEMDGRVWNRSLAALCTIRGK